MTSMIGNDRSRNDYRCVNRTRERRHFRGLRQRDECRDPGFLLLALPVYSDTNSNLRAATCTEGLTTREALRTENRLADEALQ